ncbi:MAG: S8 family serine peptidase [Candidatus Promineifilaceae bacterium]
MLEAGTEKSAPKDDAESRLAGGRGGRLAFGAAFVWVLAVTLIGQIGFWIADQFAVIAGQPLGAAAREVANGVQAVLLLWPLVPLAALWPAERYRAAFRAWALAAGYLLLLLPVHFRGRSDAQMAGLWQIGLSSLALVALVIWLLRRPPAGRIHLNAIRPSWLALGAAAVVSYPWLALGALGSLADTLLNAAAGVLLGMVAASVAVAGVWPAVQADSRGARRDIVYAGVVLGAMLLIMAAGFGFAGHQLLLMAVLPALGWLAAYLVWRHRERPVVAWIALADLIGLAAAAPLILVDADELMIILGDTLPWNINAALLTALAAWGMGALLLINGRRAYGSNRLALAGAAVVAWLVGAGLYLLVGQPGLHGDQLFVVLRQRADLSAVASVDSFDQRRQFVYDALVATAEESQAALRAELERRGVAYTPYYLVNGLAVEGGLGTRRWLEVRPEVERVLDNPILRPLPEPIGPPAGAAEPPFSTPPNVERIGANQVWNTLGVTGRGVVMGHSDSGVQGDHPELADGYRGRESSDDFNWLDPWNHTTRPTDSSGHGTHTLATALGNQVGVAPGAEWIGCVNLARNLGNPAYYLDCLQFLFAPYPQGGDPFADGEPLRSAHILNNSWGCPPIEGCDPSTMLDAVAALRTAGLFQVVSAGNNGPACSSVDSPLSLFDQVFSVGAMDAGGAVAFFSSRGPVTADGSGRIKPDILAPGTDILSAGLMDSYQVASGTSSAGPHVSGVVALMWSANPDLIGNVEKTEAILAQTARPLAVPSADCGGERGGPSNAAGYGLVNAYAAVQAALQASP